MMDLATLDTDSLSRVATLRAKETIEFSRRLRRTQERLSSTAGPACLATITGAVGGALLAGWWFDEQPIAVLIGLFSGLVMAWPWIAAWRSACRDAAEFRTGCHERRLELQQINAELERRKQMLSPRQPVS